MTTYGFDKVKKPPTKAQVAEPRRTLDVSGLGRAPVVEPSAAEDQAAVIVGERLGFVAREGEGPVAAIRSKPIKRARAAIPMKSILVKGPERVLDRFVAYANESQARSYWEVIDELLRLKGK